MIGQNLPLDSRPKDVPPEIDRWNWGAFLLNAFWGIFNRTPIALLSILPVFNVIMPFVLGVMGSRWAWQNGNWDSVERFKQVQRKWAIWGCILYLCGMCPVAVLIGASIYYRAHVLSHSEPFELATTRLQTSTEVASLLGAPITTGRPDGQIMTYPEIERANLNFSVTGSKSKAQAFLAAHKIDGVWALDGLLLRVDGGRAIELVKGSRAGIGRDHP